MERKAWISFQTKGSMINKMIPSPFPPRINIEPTNHCNMKCIMCPHGVMTRKKGTMDMKTFKNLIDECACYDSTIWLHLLGEPFLNPNIFEMIKYSHEKHIKKIGLSTNGTFLEKNIAEKILKSGLTRLECSVDAVDNQSYKEMRNSDDYDNLVDNIRYLLQLKKDLEIKNPVISIQFVKMKKSDKFLKDSFSQWKDYLNDEDFIMTIEYSSFAGQLKNSKNFFSTCKNKGEKRNPCGWLWKGTVILYNGDVTICGGDYDGKSVLGNIKNQSLESIWMGEKYNNLRRLHIERQFRNTGLCSICDEWKYGDGSRYKNVLKKNDLQSSVSLNHKTARHRNHN